MTHQDDVTHPGHRAEFDFLAEGVVWQDAEGLIVDANAAAAPILGLTPDELLGRTSRDPRWYAVHEDGSPWPGADHPGMVALRTGEPQRMRIMGIIAPRIGRRWISIHAMPRFVPGAARPVGVVASFMDVTPQIELRQRLLEQTRELSDLYEHAPCGYHMLDAQGRCLRINETELRWLGVERDQVIGLRSPKDFFTDEGRQTFAACFPRLLAGESLAGIELELVGADRQHRWVRVSAEPVLDAAGRFVASRSVLHDITESRLARAALEKLTTAQQMVLDNDLVGIVRMRSRRFVWTNRAFGRIYGYAPDELLGQESLVLFPDRAAFEAFGQAWGAAFAQGTGHRATIELRHKDGTVVWADCSGAMLDTASGESMWFSKDVTAARREEALRTQAIELAAANQQLQETARLHSTFLANVSHELRTPLNAVIGFAGILRNTAAAADDDKRNRYLDQIAGSGQHLLSIIENMLELARWESGRIAWHAQRLDVMDVIRETVDMLEPKARQHEVSIDVDGPATRPIVLLDRLRLKQVLLNYLGNAIKFSPPHGRVLVMASMLEPDRLRIEVVDHGIGISPQDQGRLFVRFQQLSSGSTKAYGGTGIGLALVKQIVEAQGGRVGVRSEVGKGSVFWAELPYGAMADGHTGPA